MGLEEPKLIGTGQRVGFQFPFAAAAAPHMVRVDPNGAMWDIVDDPGKLSLPQLCNQLNGFIDAKQPDFSSRQCYHNFGFYETPISKSFLALLTVSIWTNPSRATYPGDRLERIILDAAIGLDGWVIKDASQKLLLEQVNFLAGTAHLQLKGLLQNNYRVPKERLVLRPSCLPHNLKTLIPVGGHLSFDREILNVYDLSISSPGRSPCFSVFSSHTIKTIEGKVMHVMPILVKNKIDEIVLRGVERRISIFPRREEDLEVGWRNKPVQCNLILESDSLLISNEDSNLTVKDRGPVWIYLSPKSKQ